MSAVVDGAAQLLLPNNLLALVVLGLLAGQNAARLPLAVFAVGLMIGALLIAFALRDPPAAIALLALAAIAGLIVAIGRPLRQIIIHPLAFATGIALALNMPPQAVTIPGAIAAQLGTAIAAIAAIGLVAFVAAKAENDWQRISVRIVGSWIAASAILVIALRLAR
jgi:urease accessory protein